MARNPNDADRPARADRKRAAADPGFELSGNDATLDARARQPKLGEMGTGPLDRLIRELRAAKTAAADAAEQDRQRALTAALRRATAEKKRRAAEDAEAADPSADAAPAEQQGDEKAPAGNGAMNGAALSGTAVRLSDLAGPKPEKDEKPGKNKKSGKDAKGAEASSAGKGAEKNADKDAEKTERKRVKEAEKAERKRVKEAEKEERKAAKKAERKVAKKAEGLAEKAAKADA